MNHFRTSSASKGQYKCFHCRALVRSKDGAWHEFAHQQIFVCKPCSYVPAPKAVPPVAILPLS